LASSISLSLSYWHITLLFIVTDSIYVILQGLAFILNGAVTMMVRARALVGRFNGSSQASESLNSVQTRGTGKKGKRVINDCPTRWWSTWKFAKRLLELKIYIAILVAEGVIEDELNLTRQEWDMLADIEELLQPFMLVQQFLEGQQYVTLSFVPYLISMVRKGLEEKAENARSEVVRNLAHDMLKDRVKGFDVYWGEGQENSLFDENEVAGRGNRQKGFPRNTLIAAALDPRSKSLKGFGVLDKAKIWAEVKRLMLKIVEEVIANEKNEENVVPMVVDNDKYGDMFQGIGDNDDEVVQDIEGTTDMKIDIELAYYKSLKGLSVKIAGGALSDPLVWWQMNANMLPILSIVARRMLCVPATSAPSERVFSVAGLTISKCRTSVQPQHASDLIFLHDSWELAEECEREFNRKKVVVL
jgi:zinc finger BED domain-containing protein 1 (E3 SUMO-protein ligase ZBED1)